MEKMVSDKQKKHVMVVIGTRPEAIKMWPVIRALRERPECTVHVCLTAQHRDMLDMFVTELGIQANSDLNLMQQEQSLADLSGRLIPAFSDLLLKEQPDLVLVQGDTTTAVLAALTAFYSDTLVGHVEAGLRSGNRRSPFPEEVNRRMVSSLADLHFAPTKQARKNLLAEGVEENSVWVTGNTVIDSVKLIAGDVAQSDAPRILMTVHRRENFGMPLEEVFSGIRTVALRHPELEIVYPVHPNPNVNGPANRMLGGIENICLYQPLGYREFVAEMQKAWLIVSDSGGVQEEATALGRPVLLLRRETERPEGLAAGNVCPVVLEAKLVAGAIEELLNSDEQRMAMMKVSSVFGDGHAAPRIVSHCVDFLEFRD